MMKLSPLPLLSALCLTASPLMAAAEVPVSFQREIKPILEGRCIECHNSASLLGEVNLQTRDLAMRKRKAGAVITPGQPEKSLLYLALTLPEKEKKAMPATGHRIPKEEIALVRRWILEGAHWPDGKEGSLLPRATKPKAG